MTGLVAELGKHLAERWLALLVLPGALLLAVLAAAGTLGHAHPFDVDRLVAEVDRRAQQAGSGTHLAVVLLALLLAAAAFGVVAQGLGAVVERLWLATGWQRWPAPARWLARRRTAARRRRWDRADRQYAQRREETAAARARAHRTGSPPTDPTRDRLADAFHARDRIAAERPTHPTWMGDRLGLMATRLERVTGLDLATTWPHLWLTAPETSRAEIDKARDALTRAATLAAWGLLYLVAGALWWPGLLVAAAVVTTGWRRARAATDTYATLVATVAQLHAGEVARAVGLDRPGPITQRTGRELTGLLTDGAQPDDGSLPAGDGTPRPSDVDGRRG